MILLALVALASAADRFHTRLDVGLGAATLGGFAVRLGVAPAGILSGEVDFARVPPCLLVEPVAHLAIGLGVGGAWASGHPSLMSTAPRVRRPVTTASRVTGWVSSHRWFSAWLRFDVTSWPTGAATVEWTLAPGARLHREP